MPLTASIAIAAIGIVIVYYYYGFKKGSAIVAFVFALALANIGFDALWPEYGKIIFLASLLPLGVMLYLTRSRMDGHKRDITRP